MFRIEDNQEIIDHLTDATIDNIKIEKRSIIISFKNGSNLYIEAFDYSLSAHVAAD